MHFKDSEPYIGIFQYVNNTIYSLVESIEGQKEVNGYYDAGNLFHLDLLKHIANVKTLDPSLRERLRSARDPYEWPRGRVCYDMRNDKYEVFGPKELMNDSSKRREIIDEFNLPSAKTRFYIDPMYQFS